MTVVHPDARAPIDAAVASIDAPPESATPSALETRLRGYAKLLAIDVAIYEIIASYPGAPTGTTFLSSRYSWRLPRSRLATMTATVAAIVKSTTASPAIDADSQV